MQFKYDDDDHPVRLDTVLVSAQHDPEVDQAWLKEQLTEHVIRPVLDDVLADRVAHDEYRVLVNPTGSFSSATYCITVRETISRVIMHRRKSRKC